MRRAFFSWLFLAALVVPVMAGTEIVLEDGQVIAAADVRRDGGVYVIVLGSGGVLTLPVDVVREVRLFETKTDTPGLSRTEPRQLAGTPVEPLRPSDAQKVLGEPSRFRPDIIDPEWRPKSGFPDDDVLAGSRSTWRKSVIDPEWRPKSGFPDDDVLAGSRSTWRKSVIDDTWVPEDGFKKKKIWWESAGRTLGGLAPRATGLRGTTPSAAQQVAAERPEKPWYRRFSSTGARAATPFRFEVSRVRPTSTTSPRACAREVLRPTEDAESIAVDKIRGARYASLPIDVYRATLEKDGVRRDAVFTLAGGDCRALSGDLRDSLGVPLTRSHTMARGAEAYDAALARTGGVRLKSAEDKIDYAFALVSLIDPDVGGRREGSLVLLEEAADLESLAAREPDECAVAQSTRRKSEKKVLRQVGPPHITAANGLERVELFTWSSEDGDVVRHIVLLGADGTVSVDRKTIASHLGAHTDR